MSKKVIKDVTNIINEYIGFMYSVNSNKREYSNDKHILEEMIDDLVNVESSKYKIKTIEGSNYKSLKISEFVDRLSNTNEISSNRKAKGVYYTPSDVTEYILINSFINYLRPDNDRMFNVEEGYQQIIDSSPKDVERLIYDTTVFDPTCGTAEFLLSAFEIKINIVKKISNEKIAEEKVIDIANTIFGNDIDEYSTDISKIRLFIKISEYIELGNLGRIVKILNNNIFNVDFVHEARKIARNFTFIVGNPPYVEYSQMKIKPDNNFGNIYADVMKNSVNLLESKSVLSFVIPISYTSTPRMRKIRSIMEKSVHKQVIVNFADRPDSLFNGAHQKLSIFFGIKNIDKDEKDVLYTSSYKHWYKSERDSLFQNIEICKVDNLSEKFYPKIGNKLEKSIFKKVYTANSDSLFNRMVRTSEPGETETIFLNMRGTFYIKSFSFNPGTSEYKPYDILKKEKGLILSLLNSSLFFLYWSIISDCWHITQKELKHFYIPEKNLDLLVFEDLFRRLENRLEETKNYIGTKQVDYEYKHKEAFDIIDEIDDSLAFLYNLNKSEVNYIKNFARKYRMGIDDEKSN